MAAKLIVFPKKCCIPSPAIEELIARLIAILDERQAACADREPDVDFEDGGDAEIEVWPDWRPAKVVLVDPRHKSRRGQRRRNGGSSGCGG